MENYFLKNKMQIYKILNTVTQKAYVGKSSNYIKRFESHKRNAKKRVNRYLYDSINYYGIEKFEIFLLEDLPNKSTDFVNTREIYWIENLNTLHPNGYNMTIGGDGGNTLQSWTEEEKQDLYKSQADKRRGERPEEWKTALSLSAKKREQNLSKEKKAEQGRKASETLKRKYASGELVATTPDVKTGKEHPGYVDIDVDVVKDLIKQCNTLKQISEILGVSKYTIRERLVEKTGKNFRQWRESYGIIGRFSKPRLV